MAEITTKDEFESWLEHQPEQVNRVISSRAVLRAFPAVLPGLDPDIGLVLMTFVIARAVLTSAVVANSPPTDVKLLTALSTARSAVRLYGSAASRFAADPVAGSVVHSADRYSAPSAVRFGGGYAAGYAVRPAVRSAALSAIYTDANVLPPMAPEQCFALPLWHDQLIPDGLAQKWAKFLASPASSSPEWVFWRDWYQGFLGGTPMDWELQRRIALIDSADWEQGAAHIAGKIEVIRAEFLAEKLPLAETVEVNPETGLFRAVPVPVQNAPLLGALLAAAQDAIDDAVNANGPNEHSHDVIRLRRCIARYSNDPQRIEMDFTSAAVSLREELARNWLDDNAPNRGLLHAVEEVVRGVRATHPEVAANRLIMAEQGLRELSPEQKQQLADALPVLEAISEGTMAEDFARDIPVLVNDAILPPGTGAPKLPGADEAKRVFSRAAKMKPLWEQAFETGEKLHDSKEHKTAKVVLTAVGVSGVIGAVVKIGLWLFGV